MKRICCLLLALVLMLGAVGCKKPGAVIDVDGEITASPTAVTVPTDVPNT